MNASLVSGLNNPVWHCRLWIEPVRHEYGQRHDWRIHHVGRNRERLAGLGVECSEWHCRNVAAPVNGVWTNGSGGNWSVYGNWLGGNVPGVSGYADDTATFGAAATSGTSVTVTLDTSPQLAR